jgi:hypothetical protein
MYVQKNNVQKNNVQKNTAELGFQVFRCVTPRGNARVSHSNRPPRHDPDAFRETNSLPSK